MRDMVGISTKGRQVGLDPCAGMLAIEIACILLSKYLQLVESILDRFLLGWALAGLLKLFARHVLNQESVWNVRERCKI